MNELDFIDKRMDANGTFTPGAPVNSKDLFAGRINQIVTVLDAISRPGQHAIMFGERGVGKTSLANVLQAFFPQNKHYQVFKINCAEKINFTELWKGVFREMQLRAAADGFEPTNDEVHGIIVQFIDQDPPTPITPHDVRFVLTQLPSQNVVIIIDEFDRNQDQDFISSMVDTIKTLSDYALRATLVLVAVADSVDELTTQHPSLSRALVQIPVPRMSPSELEDIIKKGLERLEMTIDDSAKARIVKLSQGLPHYTHLLALYAVTNALERKSLNVTEADLREAIKIALEKTQESTTRSYYKAVTAPRGVLYPKVLLGCALAETDMRGYFTPASVGRALKKITGEDYDLARFTRHLREFSTPERGCVLLESGTKGQFRYRFADPMMQPFVVLRGISDGSLAPELVDSGDT